MICTVITDLPDDCSDIIVTDANREKLILTGKIPGVAMSFHDVMNQTEVYLDSMSMNNQDHNLKWSPYYNLHLRVKRITVSTHTL
jgi:hypothetical protein